MNRYTFDVKLWATLFVDAPDEATARKILHKTCDVMSCNGGAWPDGDPILFEASIEGEADLNEVEENDDHGCPSNHWNDGTDICADCGKDLHT